MNVQIFVYNCVFLKKEKQHSQNLSHFENESSFWNPFWKYMYLLTHSKCNERTVKSVHSYKWSFKNLIKVWIFCKIIWTFLNVWQCRKLSASDIQTLYKSSQKLMYRGSLPYATFGSGKKVAWAKYLPHANFRLFYFISAIFWLFLLMRILANSRIPEPKVALGKNPLYWINMSNIGGTVVEAWA